MTQETRDDPPQKPLALVACVSRRTAASGRGYAGPAEFRVAQVRALWVVEAVMADEKKPKTNFGGMIGKRAGKGPAQQGQGKPASHLPKAPAKKTGK